MRYKNLRFTYLLTRLYLTRRCTTDADGVANQHIWCLVIFI